MRTFLNTYYNIKHCESEMSKLVEKDAALEDKKTKWKDQSIVCYKRRQIMDWTQMMCT